MAAQAIKPTRRAGFSGMRVFAACDDGVVSIEMQRPDGTEIANNETITVVTTDFLAMGGDNIFTPIIPDGGFDLPTSTPFVRELFVTWMRTTGGSLNAADFLDDENPRWSFSESWPGDCQLRSLQ
jgi:hypothetical protein